MRINLFTAVSAVCCLLQACSGGDSVLDLSGMSLKEKASRLFIVRPEALIPGFTWENDQELVELGLKEISGSMREVAEEYPVGGVILFAHNISDETQLRRLEKDIHGLSGRPLLCIDEEGGRVARLANNDAFGLPRYESMTALAKDGPRAVKKAAKSIGRYLHKYGFDVDFAPVADVNTNPENIVIGPRAFSDDPETAGKMVQIYLKALQKQGVTGCLKHFPGHGDTKADTHLGYAVSYKTREELLDCEMIPFKAGISAGARMIMSAHVSLPNVTGTETPSTLSPDVLQGILRKGLGYDGVIITDALEMGAITSAYPIDEACILALEAGADILLCVRNYRRCVDAIVAAVESGRLSESRLDESLRRINKLR